MLIVKASKVGDERSYYYHIKLPLDGNFHKAITETVHQIATRWKLPQSYYRDGGS